MPNPVDAPDADWSSYLPEREALRQLREERDALDRQEQALVDEARRLAVPWRSIAADLGIGQTTVFRRHAHHDPLAAQSRKLRGDADFVLPGSSADDA